MKRAKGSSLVGHGGMLPAMSTFNHHGTLQASEHRPNLRRPPRASCVISRMEVDQSESAALPAFSFRPAKRRKVFRQRREDADSGSEKETSGSASPGPLVAVKGSPTALLSEAQGDDGLSLSEVLRMRKAAQRRKDGVEFCSSTPQPQATSVAPPSPTVTQASETSTAISMINSRFAPPTGQVADVDKHM